MASGLAGAPPDSNSVLLPAQKWVDIGLFCVVPTYATFW